MTSDKPTSRYQSGQFPRSPFQSQPLTTTYES